MSAVTYIFSGEEVSAEEFERRMKAKREKLGLTDGIVQSGPWRHPVVSKLDGVMGHQVAQARKFCEKHGIRDVKFRENGDVEYRSQSGMRAWKRKANRNPGLM